MTKNPDRRKGKETGLREVPAVLRDRARPPLGIVLGSPAEVAHLAAALDLPQIVSYQMDLFQAERVRAEAGGVRVEAKPDLWDLPADFQTLVYLPARGGNRELKIDMVEQAFHVLRPHGTLLVWSPYEADALFPALLKKVFGRVHSYFTGTDTVLACHRDGDRPRRRHEVTFQVRLAGGESCRFLSRPGTFSYGRFDNGARALMESVHLEPGERVLDLGCGCGTNGVFAAQRTGPTGHTAFVDSNTRAAALADHNARSNGLKSFEVTASSQVEGLKDGSFDVVLANPPYYAHGNIARLFIERGRELLKPDGRFYLVTRQPNETAAVMAELFENIEAEERRGYVILSS
jgi:16S rRNA (guanine1207-N2)-methyltransferase